MKGIALVGGLALALSANVAQANDNERRLAQAFETAEYSGNIGLGAINASDAYAAGFTGQGSEIAIIDGYFDVTHPEFNGNLIRYVDTANLGVPNRADFPNEEDYIGALSHGTHVAGIAAGAKSGNAMHGVAFDAKFSSYTYDATSPTLNAAAFNAAASRQPAVISNSWGYDKEIGTVLEHASFSTNVYDALAKVSGEGNAASWETFVDSMRAAQSNSVILFAATNKDTFSDVDMSAGLPLAVPTLQGAWIAVVNVNSDGELVGGHCGSARAFCLAGPGTDILSAVPVDTYREQTGTSMATPHVAGAVAIAKQMYPNATPTQLTSLVLQTATDIGDQGVDSIFGWGLLNLANLANTQSVSSGQLFASSAWSRFETMGQFGSALRQRFSPTGAGSNNGIAPIGYASQRTASTSAESAIHSFAEPDETSRISPEHKWAAGFGGFSRLTGAASGQKYESETAGFVFGVDARLDGDKTVGLAAGFTGTTSWAKNGNDSGQTQGYHLGAYGAQKLKDWTVESDIQLAYFDQQLNRRDIAGATGTSVTSVGISTPKSYAAEAQVRLIAPNLESAMLLTPYLAGTARAQRTEAYTETGAGIFSLQVPQTTQVQFEAGPGVGMETTVSENETSIVKLRANASYGYLMGDVDGKTNSQLLGQTISSTTNVGRHVANLEATLSMINLTGNVTADLTYRARLQKNARSHSGEFKVKVVF